MRAMDELTETDIVFRLVVTRRVRGALPPQRRHKYVTALRRLLGLCGDRSTYHVDVCEVAEVRPVTHQPKPR